MVGSIVCFLHRNARVVITLFLGAGMIMVCSLVLHTIRHLHGV